jgi:hypothetical protein
VRALFLLLVAANLAFLAWSLYVAPADAGRDPKPLSQQIDPDKLRILPAESEAPKTSSAKPAAKEAALPVACMEWGSFTAADTVRAEQALAPLALGERLSQRRVEETAGWWVFIPPQGNRPGAMKKAVELKALGIDDYFILQDEGPQRWAVSLGVFRAEDAAKARLEALKAKGVRSAQAGPREMQVQKVWFQLRGTDAAQQAKVRELAGAFAGTELKDCP